MNKDGQSFDRLACQWEKCTDSDNLKPRCNNLHGGGLQILNMYKGKFMLHKLHRPKLTLNAAELNLVFYQYER